MGVGGKLMNCNFYIELGQYKVDTKKIENKIKEIWRNDGNKIKDIVSLEIYFKAEESMIYYVINEVTKGKLELEVFNEQ